MTVSVEVESLCSAICLDTESLSFRLAVELSPNDFAPNGPRGVLADWCEERGLQGEADFWRWSAFKRKRALEWRRGHPRHAYTWRLNVSFSDDYASHLPPALFEALVEVAGMGGGAATCVRCRSRREADNCLMAAWLRCLGRSSP